MPFATALICWNQTNIPQQNLKKKRAIGFPQDVRTFEKKKHHYKEEIKN